LVTELRYAVYPQKSGPLVIPAIGFTAREVQPGRSLLGARLGRRLRMASEPVEINVKTVPASFPGEVWLPARALTLEEDWSINPEALDVGDSTTRTLTLTARGLQGSQLPPLSSVQGAINIPEIRFYPDQESIDQSELADGLQGRRIQSEALVARSSGTWTLPEIRVPWWNTETDSLEFAILPAKTVAVIATQPDTQINDSATASVVAPVTSIQPLWIWAVAAAGWLLALTLAVALWLSRRRPPTTPTASMISGADTGTLRQSLVQIRKAAEQQDNAALRDAILRWGVLHHGDAFSSLAALARVSTDHLATLLREVDRSLYGDGVSDGVSDKAPQGLIDALRNEPSQKTAGVTISPLRLYPS
jgi:hypothetical protein